MSVKGKKVAVLGYGVVGAGTVEVFYKNKSLIAAKTGIPENELDIKYILDLRDFADDIYADKFVKDFDVIVNDDEVAVVAELIGGTEPSFTFVKRALEAGKSVVTSNKELVAVKGAELLRTAREHSVNFFFEASVGGGIPIIRPLSVCLSTDKINAVAGILNGTTNYILTKMFRDNAAFDTALKLAQDLGYAERNPAADIEGTDTCRKISILASIITGRRADPDGIPTEGITKVTSADVQYCGKYGGAIKLIGFAEIPDDISAGAAVMVCPAFVKGDSQLAVVNDVFNAVLVRGEATGDVLFYGRGAGRLPTASAVVSDITGALAGNTENTHFWTEEPLPLLADGDISTRFYVRVVLDGKSGKADADKVKAAIRRFGTENGLDEFWFINEDGEFAVITPVIKKSLLTRITDGIAGTVDGVSVAAVMRVLDY